MAVEMAKMLIKNRKDTLAKAARREAAARRTQPNRSSVESNDTSSTSDPGFDPQLDVGTADADQRKRMVANAQAMRALCAAKEDDDALRFARPTLLRSNGSIGVPIPDAYGSFALGAYQPPEEVAFRRHLERQGQLDAMEEKLSHFRLAWSALYDEADTYWKARAEAKVELYGLKSTRPFEPAEHVPNSRLYPLSAYIDD